MREGGGGGGLLVSLLPHSLQKVFCHPKIGTNNCVEDESSNLSRNHVDIVVNKNVRGGLIEIV